MTRILLRSRKDPFSVDSPEVTHRDNIIGDNAGNLVFSHAMHRILSTEGTEITSNRFRADAADAPRINEEYDAFVVPLANAFRPSFKPQLERLTALIEQLTIPVVVAGVGAQVNVEYSNVERLSGIEETVKQFVRAVLNRSATIGVRGEFTESYLRGLGFRDVDVIGCPSMFRNGANLRVEKRLPALSRDSKISINVTPYVQQMGSVVRAHYERYPNLTYVAQDINTLELLLWGETPESAAQNSDLPIHMSHPMYRENKIRFFVDPQRWNEFLSSRDFSFGSRIHGNIVSLVAGTPAVLLAHDSRTLELAKYHEIPYRLITDVSDDVDAAELYATADYDGLNNGHKARLDRFTAFLERNGLRHVFTDGTGAQSFDERADAVEFPPGVETLSGLSVEAIAARMRWLREANESLRTRLTAKAAKATAVPPQRLASRARRKLRRILRG